MLWMTGRFFFMGGLGGTSLPLLLSSHRSLLSGTSPFHVTHSGAAPKSSIFIWAGSHAHKADQGENWNGEAPNCISEQVSSGTGPASAASYPLCHDHFQKSSIITSKTRQSRPGVLAAQDALNQPVDPSDVAGQFLWDAIASSEVRDTGRAHSHMIIVPLPDEHLEGQIKCEEWGSNHEWSASFRTAKDQHMGLLHLEADAFRFSTMVNMGKEAQILAVYGLLKAFQRLLHRKRTGSSHNSLGRGRCSRCRWLVHVSHLSPVLSKDSLSSHHRVSTPLYHSHLLAASLQVDHTLSHFPLSTIMQRLWHCLCSVLDLYAKKLVDCT